MSDPTPTPLAPPAPTTNLQELLNKKSDADLGTHLREIFDPLKSALAVYGADDPGGRQNYLIRRWDVVHPSQTAWDVLHDLQKAYFKALQPIWRQKATEDFLKKVESFQAQLDELQSQIPPQ